MRRLALKMALSAKASGKFLFVVDSMNCGEAKTKMMAQSIVNLKNNIKDFKKGSVLIALPEYDKKTLLASRNLEDVDTIEAGKLNAADVLKSRYILMPKDSIGVIEKTLAENKKSGEPVLASEAPVKKTAAKAKKNSRTRQKS
jgi:large subunit ribosomal protein L4